jgi:LysM repeat protein
MRKVVPILLIILFTLTISIAPRNARAKSIDLPKISTPSELIDAVNAIRASRGLSPYTPNSILMGIAQKQVDYILSIGTGTHISADGLRPFQRALQAGYAVAGDISQGGFFSENIVGGGGMTAEEAVQIWTGDDPHLNTMISTNLQDIGAGVAVSGNTFYYLIDCGLSTGGTPRAFTPPPSYIPPQPTMIPNTPNADGSITYIVKSGDTTLGIALAYGLTLDELLKINGLTAKSVIYPNQKIIIRTGFTPTPTQPTSTPTGLPTITAWPTSTPTSTKTPDPPTPTPSPGIPVATARGAVLGIVLGALVLASLLVLMSRNRK